ncbi:KdsC family phosphatase [Varunaivibrio sulfuroxidans]|uniref:3-deoxy-D-manno-octulosonate 8-phosphate phosphatase KdsC n=1 Tax=Varunaivibrio sulfuroxidans TaxID=1773489 RepID=A0A4R3JFK2_9PROT|nr:HAD hydrolase family protein [Varunaivibrio sulfuroxidans]TCS64053.1 3-deoxy-D-manno-octulosonate 8-phosphate phosphatase (KDO 8-P phosphatase) [Varunaivibrio sulfuroxidans]WES31496.1 HAD hydrolase family protein [Varunaivibrio sulfuroxidans]
MTSYLSADDLKKKLQYIKVLSLDVDGVLTDGGMYFDDHGGQMRKFNVKDGMGIKLVQRAGIEVCIITASTTPSIRHRAESLGIERAYLGVRDKLGTLREICAKLGVTLDQVAHIGDDINDVDVLRAVGLPLTVNDAVAAVNAVARYVVPRSGGQGAVRYVCDLLVEVQDADPTFLGKGDA